MAQQENEYPDNVLGPREIFELWKIRRANEMFQRRNRWYDRAEEYYYGAEEKMKAGNQVIAMNSLGMPVLRSLGDGMDLARRYVANLVAPIVDDNQALLGQLPVCRVLPPESSDAADKKAELETKYLLSMWDLSDMDEHHPEAMLNASMLGDACLVAAPNVVKGDTGPRQNRVMLSTVHPRLAYPSFYSGYRKNDVYDLIVACRYPAKQILRDYGVAISSGDHDANVVITYISPHQRSVVVGKLPTDEHVTWDLGLCPVVWMFNKQAGQRYGQADIMHALTLQDYYDGALNIAFDGAVEATYGMTHVVNPEGISSDGLDVGPGAVVESDESTVINRIAANVQPERALSLAEVANRDLRTVAGTTQVRQEGDMHSSIITGRAIHNAQGPQATRMDLKIRRVARSLEKINEAALTMQEKAPYLGDAKLTLWGRHKGKEFHEEFEPGRDIDGWVRNTVSFEKLIGMNLQQKSTVAMQMVASQLAAPITAREMVGIEDPVGEWDKIQQSMIERARAEAQAQAIAQGGGQSEQMVQQTPGAPGVAFQPTGGPGGPSGPQPPPGGTPMMRPRGMTPPAPAGGVPTGSTVEAMRRALVMVAGQLHGQVFAIGDLAREGISAKPMLRITDWRDYRVVKPAAEAVTPMVDVKHMEADKLPDIAVLIV